MSLLDARNVTVRLGGYPAVADATLRLEAGTLIALVGPNGAGKTTLMRALAGLLRAEGTIALGGTPLVQLSARDRARTVAYLPQGHVFHWPISAAEVAQLGRYPHADPFVPPTPADRAAVAQALAAAGVEAFASRQVTTLSGGERARVALARALATQAPILMADEPTASLDPRHQLVVMDMLRGIAQSGGAVLVIVHDLTLAARYADRVVVMDRGRIVADAPPGQALAAGMMAAVFGVDTLMIEADGRRVPLPLRPI